MSNYSTITDGSAPGGGSAGDMARHRRGRSPKDGGGQASTVSSVVNLVNTIVGAGTLAMPFALSHFGIVLGVILIVWCGLTSAFGLYLQSRCARYLERGTASFFALSQITYPNAAVVFDAAIAVKCFGVGVSYLIIIGDLMPGVMEGFSSRANEVPFLVDRNFWVTAFMLVIIPLSFLRRLDSLKYTSFIALVSIGYLIVLVVYHFAAEDHPARGDLRVIGWAGPVAALSSLPVVIFAYTCHQNMFSILNEIKDGSPASVMRVITSSIGSAASIYILVAITGYLTFGNYIAGNIVSMYPPSVASTVGKAAIVILVMFSVPLQVHPCRASLDAVLKWRPNSHSGASIANTHSLLPSGPAGRDSHGSPAAPMSEIRFSLLTTVILVCSYMTALSVSSLDRVLAYVGSTGSTAISFILPGLFYYKISNPEGMHHQRLMKEDDDLSSPSSADERDEPGGGILEAGRTGSVRSGTGGTDRRAKKISRSTFWRWWRRLRWDMEHIEDGLLRKLALSLSIYGMCVMAVCLVSNTFFIIRE